MKRATLAIMGLSWLGVATPAAASPAAHAPPAEKAHRTAPASSAGRSRPAPKKTASGTKAETSRPHASSPKPKDSSRATPKVPARRGPAKHVPGHAAKCQHSAVKIERAELHEVDTVALTDCDGRPRRAAQEALSSLARLRGTPKPGQRDFEDAAEDGEVVDRGVALMHHGLLERLQRIADHFPAKTISVVSGYRPQSDGSMHQRARAIDIHLDGVDNVTLVDFCKTLEDTGCGYYPNSSFVHVDVRPHGSGKVTWIDASGPGEKPRYVTSWPPQKCDLEAATSTGDDPYSENTPAGADESPKPEPVSD